jgi:rhodanese-related sulfurtransferase
MSVPRAVRIAVAAVLLAACARDGTPATSVTAEAFAAELASGRADDAARLVIVDLRAPSRYEEGHIPGAISLPWPDAEARAPRALDRTHDIVLVDDDGTVSETLAATLTAAGFPRVRVVDGGMARWRGPLERSS